MGEVSSWNWRNAKCVHMLVGKPEGARRVRGTTSRRNGRTIWKRILKNKVCPSGLDWFGTGQILVPFTFCFRKRCEVSVSEACLFNSAVSCKGFVASMTNEGFASVEYWWNDTDWKTDLLQILCHSCRACSYIQYVILQMHSMIHHLRHISIQTCFGTELPSSGSHYNKVI